MHAKNITRNARRVSECLLFNTNAAIFESQEDKSDLKVKRIIKKKILLSCSHNKINNAMQGHGFDASKLGHMLRMSKIVGHPIPKKYMFTLVHKNT